MAYFPALTHPLSIPGSEGLLEAVLETPHPQSYSQPSGILAIVCHPHPLYGGTFNNKVVTTLSRLCTGLGHTALRFNYRGVGQSAGQYGNIEGEVNDLLCVIDWMSIHYPYQTLWLMGFSFGAYIAARGAIERPCTQLVQIAPAVGYAHFETLPRIPCPWVIIQGDQDEVIAPQKVYDFADARPEHPTLFVIPNASHFFHGRLSEMRDYLTHYLEALAP